MNSIVSEGDDVLPVVAACIAAPGYDILDLTSEYLVLSAGDTEVLIGDDHTPRPITEHQCSAVS
jgi:hypothetical protein